MFNSTLKVGLKLQLQLVSEDCYLNRFYATNKYMVHWRILHECSCFIEFLNELGKKNCSEINKFNNTGA